MEPRGVMGGIYRLTEWIMRLSVINLLWILCGAPFFIFFFMSFIALVNGQVPEEEMLAFVQTACLTLGVLAPFTFFPSTAAMFSVARKWVTGEADVPMFKTFFKGYKANFKQSMLGGIIYTILIAVLIVDYYFFMNSGSGQIVSGIFIGLIVLAIVSLLNFFSMLVHYHMKTFQLIKNSVLITIGKPLRSITSAIMVAVVLYFSFFTQFTWLTLFFTGSVIAVIAYWNFNLIYTKLQQQLEDMKKNEEEEVEIAAEMDREDLVKSDYKESK